MHDRLVSRRVDALHQCFLVFIGFVCVNFCYRYENPHAPNTTFPSAERKSDEKQTMFFIPTYQYRYLCIPTYNTDTFASSADPDETAHNKPSHQDPHCHSVIDF